MDTSHPPEPPIINLPPMTKALCLANAAVFLALEFLPGLFSEDDVYALAFVPARYFAAEGMSLKTLLTPVTYMLIHAGWMHFLVNTAMLMAFGTGLEKTLGGRRLLVLYVATGVAAAFFHAALYPASGAPIVGASGGISGLFGGIVMAMAARKGEGWASLFPFIALWVAISLFFGVFGMPGSDNAIAWAAHIGGFITGMALLKPVSRLP